MIIKEYKSIFVHVPKAAGQSVENFILNTFNTTRKEKGAEYLLRYNEDPGKGPQRLAHLTASGYVKYGYITNDVFNDYYKFTIVRNPWARMLSFYKFRGYSNLISFSDFMIHFLPYCFKNEHWFFRPQSDFLYDDQDNLLVDFVGKMENINSDFSIIAAQLGINFDTLPKNNHSISKGLISRKSLELIKKHPRILKYCKLKTETYKNYQEAYCEKSKEMIIKYYQRDIDLLGYSF